MDKLFSFAEIEKMGKLEAMGASFGGEKIEYEILTPDYATLRAIEVIDGRFEVEKVCQVHPSIGVHLYGTLTKTERGWK